MKFTEYFIRHKVSSIILNMMILIIGFLCLQNISIREYPNVQIPVLSVRTIYPNASANLVESAITSVLEDALSGVSGIKYMVSSSAQSMSSITITFTEGTNIENALIELRGGINDAKAKLPKDLKEPQITRGSDNEGETFFAISITSNSMNFSELTHYALKRIKDNFRSINGVATVDVWGQPYTMQVTIDQKKLYAYGINVSDIISALSCYNISLPVGKFQNTIPSTMNVNITEPEEFENTYIATKNNRAIYLKDLAKIELLPDGTQFRVHVNGISGIALGLQRNSDANPLDVASDIRKEIDRLKLTLPSDMQVHTIIDQSTFITSSLHNIYHSIFEAIVLVLIIVYIFLSNLRATIIPLITIPFSLIGSIAIIYACGMSINTLTLLAMVLAIGLVVDDAIIMLENITRHIEEGMKPFDAAIKGASEIGFAIIAMTLTLASVYAPIAFIKGTIGQLFIEFAVALSGSVIISGIVALTLSPMMCSAFLKPQHEDKKSAMHKFLAQLDKKYSNLLHIVLTKPKLILAIIISSLLVIYLSIKIMPAELAPKEDRGLISVFIPPVAGTSIDDMELKAQIVEDIVATIPEKAEYLSFMGTWGSYTIAPLKDFSDRKRHQSDIVNSITPLVGAIPSFDAYASGWDSALPGIDSSGASNLSLVVSSAGDFEELSEYADKMLKAMNKTGKFTNTRQNIKFDTSGYDIILNYNRIANLQIQPQTISDQISAFFSGNQNLQFKKDDILYDITIIGNTLPWNLSELYVNTTSGTRQSIGSFASLNETVSISKLPHYNQLRAVTITGTMMPDVSLESAMPTVMKLADEIFPESFKKEWAGAAQASLEASGTIILMFLMALVFIYSILAVQFDNFLDPFIIMITVPLACSGALLTSWIFGQSMNIYTQIGIITLVGLITKHGILIVEFANKLLSTGEGIEQSVTDAAIIRLRPILMTTGAMILGSFPLVFSSGAGFEARKAIGIVLIGGLGFGTFFTLFVLPKIYCWVKEFEKNAIHSQG